jgi:hypothetical protein
MLIKQKETIILGHARRKEFFVAELRHCKHGMALLKLAFIARQVAEAIEYRQLPIG